MDDQVSVPTQTPHNFPKNLRLKIHTIINYLNRNPRIKVLLPIFTALLISSVYFLSAYTSPPTLPTSYQIYPTLTPKPHPTTKVNNTCWSDQLGLYLDPVPNQWECIATDTQDSGQITLKSSKYHVFIGNAGYSPSVVDPNNSFISIPFFQNKILELKIENEIDANSGTVVNSEIRGKALSSTTDNYILIQINLLYHEPNVNLTTIPSTDALELKTLLNQIKNLHSNETAVSTNSEPTKTPSTATPTPSSVPTPTSMPTTIPTTPAKPTCKEPVIWPSKVGTAPYQITAQPQAEVSSPLQGGIDSYEWDFNGDGYWDSIGNLNAQQYTYQQSGTYSIQMRVRATNGEYSDVCQTIISVN